METRLNLLVTLVNVAVCVLREESLPADCREAAHRLLRAALADLGTLPRPE